VICNVHVPSANSPSKAESASSGITKPCSNAGGGAALHAAEIGVEASSSKVTSSQLSAEPQTALANVMDVPFGLINTTFKSPDHVCSRSTVTLTSVTMALDGTLMSNGSAVIAPAFGPIDEPGVIVCEILPVIGWV